LNSFSQAGQTWIYTTMNCLQKNFSSIIRKLYCADCIEANIVEIENDYENVSFFDKIKLYIAVLFLRLILKS